MQSLKSKVAAGVLSLSALGAAGIVAHEGMRKVAYVDPVGIVTVCAGHTRTAKLGQTKTSAECAELLQSDAKYAEQVVKRSVKIALTQRQFDALVSFVFNVGEGNFTKSSLLRKVNALDCYGAGAEFMRWTNAGGHVLPGLVTRRQSERAEWESGCPKGVYKTYTSLKQYPIIHTNMVHPRRPTYGILWTQ